MAVDDLKWPYYLLAGAAIICLLPGAAATFTQETCAEARQPDSVNSYLSWQLKFTGYTCNLDGTPGTILTVSPGDPFYLVCQHTTIGVPTALPATAISLSIVDEAVSFPSNNPTTVRTVVLGGADLSTCTTSGAGPTSPIAFYCTDDGQSGGNPRAGILRLHVRVERAAGLGDYVTSSDVGSNARHGIVDCTNTISAFAEGASPPTGNYRGGNNIGITIAAGNISYRSGNDMNATVQCDGYTDTRIGSLDVTTTNQSITNILKGARTDYANSCDLRLYTYPLFSTLEGFTSRRYFTINATTDGALTGDGGVVNDITRTVNRNLAVYNACERHLVIGMHPSITAANRGQTIELHCQFRRASDATDVTNNQLARAWITDDGSFSEDIDASDPFDTTFGSQGSVAATYALKTTAPTGPHVMAVQTYGVSRTEAEIYNFGIGNNSIELSSQYFFDNILHAKMANGTDNFTEFAIGLDQAFITPRGLATVNGVLVSGAPTSCERFTPPPVTSFDSKSHGTTDANGDAEEKQYDPSVPRGTWSLTCTATLNGNTAVYTIEFEYTSQFTADTKITIAYREIGDNLNFTVVWRQYDPDTDNVTLLAPEGNVTLFFQQETINGDLLYPPVLKVQMTKYCPLACAAWYIEVPKADIITPNRNTIVYAHGNVSGNAYIESTFVTGAFELTEITLITELDQWVAIIIWGVLMMIGLRRQAWAPAIAALINIGASLPDPDIFGLPAQVMLFVVSYVGYHIAERGILPTRRDSQR